MMEPKSFRQTAKEAFLTGIILAACLFGGAIIAIAAIGQTAEQTTAETIQELEELAVRQVDIGLANICQLGVETTPTDKGTVERPEDITNTRCLLPNHLPPQDNDGNGFYEFTDRPDEPVEEGE